MKRVFQLLMASLLISDLSGCSTYNPATGRNEFIMIPTAEEVAMGKTYHKKIAEEFKISNRADYNLRVSQMTTRLKSVSDRQDYAYHVYVIEKDELNAFTVPGGYIYIFSGLMDKMPSEDALASVIAHEMGHCAAKHVVKKFQALMGYNLVGSLALSYLGKNYPQAQSLASHGAGAILQLATSAYGRRDELEADKLGLKYLYKAGYNLQGMVDAFGVLAKESTDTKIPTILRTHPHIKDRLQAVKLEIEKIKNKEIIY